MYHLAEYPHQLRTNFAAKTILKYYFRKKGRWVSLNGEEVSEACLGAAKAFAHIKLPVGARIGIYSPNMAKVLFAEIGLFMMRGVSVPLYATSSPEQVQFVVEDAGVEIMFVGEQFQYNNAYEVLKKSQTLKRLIVLDDEVILDPEDTTTMYWDEFVRRGDSMSNQTIAQRTASTALETDLAVIIYTSGTSGNSKGVMLLHSNFMHQIKAHHERFPFIGSKEVVMSFLPMSHIFEKAWGYFCLSRGCTYSILRDPKRILEALPIIKPSMMCNVPRFWEKVYIGVHEKIEKSPKLLRRIFHHAIKVGARYRLDYSIQRKKAPLWLWLMFHLYDRTIFQKVKRAVGLQNGKFFPVAGAPLSLEIQKFLQSINIPIIFGYGLSETTATVSCFERRGFDITSIGTVVDGLEVKIDPTNSEILVKGPTVTPGYYHNEEANREAFTEDNFFRTGDAGRLEGKTLYFTERLKDLFKTANGKYIAPQMIEGLLTADPIVEQVAVIADGYKFVSALIYPNWEILKREGEKRKVNTNRPLEELAEDHELHRIMNSHIEEALGSLAQYEKVKRFALLSQPFSMETGELTATLKLKRKVINERYKVLIEQMYSY